MYDDKTSFFLMPSAKVALVFMGAALVLQSCKTVDLIGDVPATSQDVISVTESAACALWCSEKDTNSDGDYYGYSADPVFNWESSMNQYNAVLAACSKVSSLDSDFRYNLQSGRFKILSVVDDSWDQAVYILSTTFNKDRSVKSAEWQNSGECYGKKYAIEITDIKKGIVGKKQVFLWAAPAGNEVIASPRKGSFYSVEPSASETIGHYWLFVANEIRAQFAIRGFALSLAILFLSIMLFLCWRVIRRRCRR